MQDNCLKTKYIDKGRGETRPIHFAGAPEWDAKTACLAAAGAKPGAGPSAARPGRLRPPQTSDNF